MICTNCGANNPAGSTFCSVCGQRFAAQPPQRPIPSPTPGMGMIPPKKRNAGLIVLVCVLSLIAAAAVTLLCLKLFMPPKGSENFNAAVKAIVSDAQPSAQTGNAQPQPTATPSAAPTNAPVQSPQPQGQTLNLPNPPFAFTTLNYPQVEHGSIAWNGIGYFEDALVAQSWVYKESHVNPDAVMFDGGYFDIGYSSDVVFVLEFGADGTLVEDYDGAYNIKPFFTREAADMCMAVYPVSSTHEFHTELNGTAYDVMLVVFAEEDTLVQSAVLYDPLTGQVIHISNYNVFEPQAPETPEADFGSVEPAAWPSQEAFEQTVAGGAWQYAGTQFIGVVFDIPEFADITPYAGRLLRFDNDYKLNFIYMDIGTGDMPDDGWADYGFGDQHAYVVTGDYDMPDELFEVNYHYYIDVSGRLIETIRFYSYDTDTYYTVSNANIYIPYQP